jgi:hypothetical protein
MNMEKICKKCLESKHHNLFYNRKGVPDGKYSYCIPCTKINQSEYRKTETYKTGNVKRHKKWRLSHKEEFGKHNRSVSKRNAKELTDSYIIKRLKGRRNTLTAGQLREYPLLIEAARVNLKIIRKLNENN